MDDLGSGKCSDDGENLITVREYLLEVCGWQSPKHSIDDTRSYGSTHTDPHASEVRSSSLTDDITDTIVTRMTSSDLVLDRAYREIDIIM